jgi:membrane fusion protein (multidrug efflux system)
MGAAENGERVTMKKWLITAIVLLALAGTAFAIRQAGVDLVALAGLKPSGSTATVKTENAKPLGQRSGSQGRSALPVEIAKAQAAQISDDIGAIGTLLAEETVEIAPETSGRVSAVMFKDGEKVEAGQPLFQLDTELAAADLAEAQARLSLAETTFRRNETLRKSGNIAQSAFDAAETEREMARAAAESAQVRLNKLTIVAPFSGIAGFRTISVGAYVTAGTALVKLDKVDLLKVKFALPELVLSRITLGQTIDVTADALPGESFSATISAIDPSIDVNGRALQVRADLDNSGMRLRPGLLVRVTVKGNQREAVVVPETAVNQRGDSSVVYLVRDSKAEEKQVRTGKREGGTIEIVEGIEAGAEVVVAGNARLSDGAAVEVVPAPKVD